MIKKIYISFLLFSLCFNIDAQQLGICSHEFYKPMITNPAFTGSTEYTNVMLISRAQWLEFKNAPQLNIFTLDGAIPNKKMGIGIDLFSDKKGISNRIGGNIFYAYILKINDDTKLRLGIALGVTDHTLHYSQAIVEDATDLTIQGNTQRKTSLNGNAGIGFTWKKLEIGVAAPQLLGNALEYEDNVTGKASYAMKRHYMGSLKYQFLISKEKQISITPMAFVHYLPNVPMQYNANLNLEWKDKFWVGATYKSDYAVAANAGICISKQLYVGYSYDFIIGNIGKYSGMSHELMINFVFGKKKAPLTNDLERPVAIQKEDPKTDSLQAELEIKNNKLKNDQEQLAKLNEELNKLKTENERLKTTPAQPTGNPPANTNPATNNQTTNTSQTAGNQPSGANGNSVPVNSMNENKTIEKGINIIKAKNNEFTYLTGKPASKGYYVVIGTFFYRDFAEAELKRTKTKGYSSADIIYSSVRNYNYVTTSFTGSKEAALKNVESIKEAGIKDAWILSLEE